MFIWLLTSDLKVTALACNTDTYVHWLYGPFIIQPSICLFINFTYLSCLPIYVRIHWHLNWGHSYLIIFLRTIALSTLPFIRLFVRFFHCLLAQTLALQAASCTLLKLHTLLFCVHEYVLPQAAKHYVYHHHLAVSYHLHFALDSFLYMHNRFQKGLCVFWTWHCST